jgi:hypothetical protein
MLWNIAEGQVMLTHRHPAPAINRISAPHQDFQG